VVIATEWKEFKEIDWSEVYKHMKKPAFVFDGRLLVDAEALTKIGFKVRRICFLLVRFLTCSRSPPLAVRRFDTRLDLYILLGLWKENL
jgi:hypothetical protein